MKYIIKFVLIMTLAINAKAQNMTETKSAEPIADFVEVEPQFPGGPEAMGTFIQSNIIYPEYSRENDEQGTVYVQFVVNLDGSISEVKVLKGVSSSLDAEAIRVIKLMPTWIPGEQKGKPVRVRYTIPINFIIQDIKSKEDKKKKKKSKEQLIIIEP